jgi:cellulose biosynthesis protein BcsQ
MSSTVPPAGLRSALGPAPAGQSAGPRLAGPPPRAAKRGRLMAVASGKGGVGKTFFSITLSHALARRGQRTLLFDGDLGLANIDIQLGLMPQYDLGSVIAGKLSLNQAAMQYEPGGFDVIAGTVRLRDAREYPALAPPDLGRRPVAARQPL